MKPPDNPSEDELLGSAGTLAMMEARWQATRLSSRRPESAVPDMLRGLAEELATSPIARDQLLSFALEAAAEDLLNGRPPLANNALRWRASAVDRAEQLRIQREVFERFGSAEEAAYAVVTALEAKHRREVEGPGAFAGVANRLLDDARLHKLLWDDPRIRADAAARLEMLCSVPRLVDRARELDPLRLGLVRSIVKWPRGRTGCRQSGSEA